ncbi:MAG: carboxypeptidase-like regulatory domain-containing protein [Planctomycetota bacterium]
MHGKRSIALGALAAIAAAALWLAFGSYRPAAPAPAPGVAGSQAGSLPPSVVTSTAAAAAQPSDAGTAAPRTERPARVARPADQLVRVVEHSFWRHSKPTPGVPVALFDEHGPDRRRLWSGVTGRRGEVAIPAKLVDGRRGQAMVALALPMATPITAILPKEPGIIELRKPPTGKVDVRFRDAFHQRFYGSLRVGLRALEPGELLDAPPRFAATWCLVAEGDGVARFRYVGLDTRLMLWIEGQDAPTGEAPSGPLAYACGPTSGDDDITLWISVDEQGALAETSLTGRVLRRNGAPLCDARFRGRRCGSRPRTLHLFTDARGRFRHALGLSHDDDDVAEGLAWLRVWRDGDHTDAPIPRLGAAGSTHDLGTLRLGTAPVAVSGQVVDQVGRPIARATVWVERARQAPRGTDWSVLDDLVAKTDERGEFRIDGTPSGDLRLLVTKRSYGFRAPIPFRPGTRGLRVALFPEATVIATALSPDRWAGVRPRLCLEGQTLDRRSVRFPKRIGHRWIWRGLAPGRYIMNAGSGPNALQISGIVVEAGREQYPRELQGLRAPPPQRRWRELDELINGPQQSR